PGNFGTTFAALYPERTVAFIRYHSHLRGAPLDVDAVKNIPALLIAGGKDETAGSDDAEALWRSGRSAGAPWTFAIDPQEAHANEASVVSSHELILPWIAAIIRLRLATGSARLQPIGRDGGWFGDGRTGDFAPGATFAGQKAEASWLPDEAAARGWRAV